MTDKIGLIDEEYYSFQRKMANIHKEFISSLDTFKNKIRNVNTISGGLYTNNVSNNINSLISSIDEIEKTISDLFTAEEELINSYVEVIDSYDTCC